MRVSATEEPESPHEGTGGAGPVLSRRYWPSRPLRYRRWARISINWSGRSCFNRRELAEAGYELGAARDVARSSGSVCRHLKIAGRIACASRIPNSLAASRIEATLRDA